MSKQRFSSLALGFSGLALIVACSSGTGDEPEDSGSAFVALTQAPADVQCVRITAEGSRTVVGEFDVQPGQSTVLPMNKLPTGPVNFSAGTFNTPCAAVPPSPCSDPTCQPGWISDVVTTELVSGVPAEVTLMMKRNGLANVNVDFEDDSCLPTLQACTASSQCCSSSCVNSRCCVNSGAACTNDSMCCSGTCDVTTGTCSSGNQCRQANEPCGSPANCCAGSTCSSSGICTTTTCRAQGQACGSNNDCCEGLGCADGICSQSGCRQQGSFCSADGDCCSPLACINGVCGSDACRPEGQACGPNNPCCTGLTCGSNGICSGTECLPVDASCDPLQNECCSGLCNLFTQRCN